MYCCCYKKEGEERQRHSGYKKGEWSKADQCQNRKKQKECQVESCILAAQARGTLVMAIPPWSLLHQLKWEEQKKEKIIMVSLLNILNSNNLFFFFKVDTVPKIFHCFINYSNQPINNQCTNNASIHYSILTNSSIPTIWGLFSSNSQWRGYGTLQTAGFLPLQGRTVAHDRGADRSVIAQVLLLLGIRCRSTVVVPITVNLR